jgi:hypothetical protein
MSQTIHHRHQATTVVQQRFSTIEHSDSVTAPVTTDNNNNINNTQQQRRRRKRRPERDNDLTLILVLIGVVCIAILVGLVVVVRLWQSMPSSGGSPKERWFGGRVATNPRGGSNSQKLYNPPLQSAEEEFPDLPPSKIYSIPHSMSHIGDRSDEYAQLRKNTDAKLPYQPERSLQFLQEMIQNHHHQPPKTFEEDVPYDIYNCPDIPPLNYPHEWNTVELLEHWNPEETTNIPEKIHQGLCVFDYRTDYVKALTYRNAELPFVVRNDPEVAVTVERWASPGFLEQLMGGVMHRAEISQSNHFMYWVPGDAKRARKIGNPPPAHEPPGWSSPTKMIRMTFGDFLEKAHRPMTHHDQHWYFRLIGCGETGPTGDCDAGSSEWLFDELTFFQPRTGLLYLRDPTKQRGIHCRMGMEGVTIANHFDQSRNAIALLGGERRYILSHPKHCPNLALYPRGHPSARHSAVDWSDPDIEAFPEFSKAMSNEILLQAGDVLYLPTNYFHYIVNLGLNYQCNTRSGTDEAAMETIRECGF